MPHPLALFLSVLVLAGCGEAEGDDLVGEYAWVSSGAKQARVKLTLKADRTFEMIWHAKLPADTRHDEVAWPGPRSGTWACEGSRVWLTSHAWPASAPLKVTASGDLWTEDGAPLGAITIGTSMARAHPGPGGEAIQSGFTLRRQLPHDR